MKTRTKYDTTDTTGSMELTHMLGLEVLVSPGVLRAHQQPKARALAVTVSAAREDVPEVACHVVRFRVRGEMPNEVDT